MVTKEKRMEVQAPAGVALMEKKFPVGMRVVAVDDDEISLAILNRLLRKCEYRASCFSSSKDALKMIKENKDEIDIVITDVHMPDIDGFQLLQIVGLELDLPVIMLSANETTEAVMKGIMHGACDYIIKPVRLEELQVIWKHVARRRKSLQEMNKDAMNKDAVNKNKTEVSIEKNNNNSETRRSSSTGSGKRTSIANTRGKRRKEESSEEDSSDEDYVMKAPQKKARVVWSAELHRKFVNAVSDIGVDKAVPKSILERMSIGDLTRENVASHLQKYRLYLKRMSSRPNDPQAQAGFGSKNRSDIDLSSFERFRNFHLSGRYRHSAPINPTPSYPPTRFNTAPVVNYPNPSIIPNLVPQSQPFQFGRSTGFPNTGGGANNSFFLNNQANLYKGITGMNNPFSSASSNSNNLITQVSNKTNFIQMTIMPPPSESMPSAPPLGYPMENMPLLGPQFGGSTNLIGENYTSGTGGDLQHVVSSFNNTSRSVPNNITENPNNFNYGNLDPSFFINPTANNAPPAMVGPARQGGGGGFGEASFGVANSVATEPMSSSSMHGGDDVAVGNIDDLLASMLKPADGGDPLSFMDDDLFN